MALDEQLPIVDLARHFEDLPDVRPYFYDTMHTNSEGMALIAGFLEAGLVREGLLGPPASAASLVGQ